MAEIRIGTQSWTSPGIKATLYPPGTRASDYLKVYANTLTDTVEADTTFYNVPTRDTLEKWYAATPTNFVFSVKMHQHITHEKRLIGVERETFEFLENVRLLKRKLGPVLIQLPPEFHSGYFAPLEKYLSKLPDDIRFAFEIRDNRWMQPRDVDRFMDLLRKYRIAFVLSDSWGVDHGDRVTTDFAYIRLNANDHWMPVDQAEKIIRERERELDRWSELMQKLASRNVNAYCYINECFENNAASSVRSLQRRLGQAREPMQTLFG